jgi:hypothetical protein
MTKTVKVSIWIWLIILLIISFQPNENLYGTSGYYLTMPCECGSLIQPWVNILAITNTLGRSKACMCNICVTTHHVYYLQWYIYMEQYSFFIFFRVVFQLRIFFFSRIAHLCNSMATRVWCNFSAKDRKRKGAGSSIAREFTTYNRLSW